MVHPITTKTYAERATSQSNPAAKRLLELMDRKQTNLCVSVDVTTTQEVLDIVKAVGPSVCMVKVSHEN
jgi:orotidine-5'-phosphate decarboxylase